MHKAAEGAYEAVCRTAVVVAVIITSIIGTAAIAVVFATAASTLFLSSNSTTTIRLCSFDLQIKILHSTFSPFILWWQPT